MLVFNEMDLKQDQSVKEVRFKDHYTQTWGIIGIMCLCGDDQGEAK